MFIKKKKNVSKKHRHRGNQDNKSLSQTPIAAISEIPSLEQSDFKPDSSNRLKAAYPQQEWYRSGNSPGNLLKPPYWCKNKHNQQNQFGAQITLRSMDTDTPFFRGVSTKEDNTLYKLKLVIFNSPLNIYDTLYEKETSNHSTLY